MHRFDPGNKNQRLGVPAERLLDRDRQG
jgi:hypothetical protein